MDSYVLHSKIMVHNDHSTSPLLLVDAQSIIYPIKAYNVMKLLKRSKGQLKVNQGHIAH